MSEPTKEASGSWWVPDVPGRMVALAVKMSPGMQYREALESKVEDLVFKEKPGRAQALVRVYLPEITDPSSSPWELARQIVRESGLSVAVYEASRAGEASAEDRDEAISLQAGLDLEGFLVETPS